ncbi:Flavin-dependent tryptophan halogenase RebH [Thalassocella blandensis]|nr:Flavin-dependent tryptophan halogenase RebH [Thalassocella blandensis]
MKKIRSVVVVGGGTAGWITAGRIAALQKKRLGKSQNATDKAVQVLLVESANKPPIGVGEGTWPTMRNTLRQLDIRESDFIKHCDATFKQGAKFSGWVTGKQDDYYYHPLVLPQDFSQVDIAPYWLWQKQQQQTESFSKAVCFQEYLCEQNQAPKNIRTPEYAGIANYAYHLNSEKFSRFLQQHCMEHLDVKHLVGDVTGVQSQPNGDIESLVISGQEAPLAGDLFIDCTGFSSILLGKHFNVPLTSCEDVLFADTALATRVNYDSSDAPIATHTNATAQNAGWIWDIGLQTRRGIGYVYSSKHSSEEAALAELLRYTGGQVNEADVRKIPINSGYRQTFWKNNCVAVGLSAGFIEPLEASALVLVELSASMIAEQFPATRELMDIVAKRFNDTFSYRWQRIVDFLKLHYVLTKRQDTAFWKDNQDMTSVPESLQELLQLWRYHSPRDYDFTSNNEVFPAASWQYVLFGMGFEADYSHTYNPDSYSSNMANQAMMKNKGMVDRCVAQLPKHRELIDKIHQYGLQSI